MKIEVYHPPTDSSQEKGNHLLIYGKSGVGKTATILQTAADPIFYLMAEGRSIDSTLKAINRPDIKLKIGYYSEWDDLLETMFNVDNFKKIKTVFGDSMSHIMNIHLPDEILEENFDARDKEKAVKDLTNRVKGTPEMYGAMSKQMSRLMKACQEICLSGVDVIWSARDQDNPKWNLELSCGPALSGKEFPRDVKGFFDFIGMVESAYDKDGNIIYPPVISCDDNGAYLSKWTGCKPPGGVIRKPFNVQKLLAVAHGKSIQGGAAAST
jgi:hypothetical protein